MFTLIEFFLIFFALVSWCIYSIFVLFNLRKTLTVFLYCGLFFHFAWIVYRTVLVTHAPFSNAYESILFFSFLYFLKISFSKYWTQKRKAILILPAEILLIIGLLLPETMKIPNFLVPALQSFWMFIHVPSFFIGYTSLTYLFVLCLLEFFLKKDFSLIIKSELKQSFFFITLGIITGGFWADQCWASFWYWDPKEIWALVTFILLTAAFHCESKKIKYIFIYLSFFAMLFTYFGVMFLLSGLHSYK